MIKKKKKKKELDFFIKAGRAYEKFRYQEEAWQSLEAILTLVTVIFLGILAISPTVRAISDLVSEINNKEELSGKMRVKINQMIETQVVYAQIQPEVFLLDQYYPKVPAITTGLAQLLGLAQQQGLSIDRLNLSAIDFSKLPLGLDFSLSIHGSYSQNKSYLSSLYQTRRGVEISGYQINKVEEEEGDLVETVIRGKLLFSKEKEQK